MKHILYLTWTVGCTITLEADSQADAVEWAETASIEQIEAIADPQYLDSSFMIFDPETGDPLN